MRTEWIFGSNPGPVKSRAGTIYERAGNDLLSWRRRCARTIDSAPEGPRFIARGVCRPWGSDLGTARKS
jgi:hypothetical protein